MANHSFVVKYLLRWWQLKYLFFSPLPVESGNDTIWLMLFTWVETYRFLQHKTTGHANISDEWKGTVITYTCSIEWQFYLPGSSKWPRLDPYVTFSGLKWPPFGESIRVTLKKLVQSCVFLWKHSECFQSATMLSSLQRGVLFVAVAIFSQATFDTSFPGEDVELGKPGAVCFVGVMWDDPYDHLNRH